MPRKACIDLFGALHPLIIRGIERKRIFRDNQDRDNSLSRLGKVLAESKTAGYAWALLPNHAHFLLRTGQVPLATVMVSAEAGINPAGGVYLSAGRGAL